MKERYLKLTSMTTLCISLVCGFLSAFQKYDMCYSDKLKIILVGTDGNVRGKDEQTGPR